MTLDNVIFIPLWDRAGVNVDSIARLSPTAPTAPTALVALLITLVVWSGLAPTASNVNHHEGENRFDRNNNGICGIEVPLEVFDCRRQRWWIPVIQLFGFVVPELSVGGCVTHRRIRGDAAVSLRRGVGR